MCIRDRGYGYCKETAEEAAKVLGVPETAVLVASTGVIGMQLPMDLSLIHISIFWSFCTML